MKIRKAVIPVAGLGTRFLPATLAVPKELLPIVDRPSILYNAEELVAAGIEELILITSEGKSSIEKFFGAPNEIEAALERAGKLHLIQPLLDLRKKLRVTSVPQGQPLGLGHAILCAEKAVGREPFAVLLGDEIMVQKPKRPSATAQLCQIYEKTGRSAVAVMKVPPEDVVKYGIVDVRTRSDGFWDVQNVVEKPAIGEAPSEWALPGRYIFDPEIFLCLKEVKPGRGGEIQLTDGMTLLAQRKGLVASTVDALRFDAGDKLGFLQANVEMALCHPELGAPFKKYLLDLVGGLS